MAHTQTEPTRLGDWLKFEEEHSFSRSAVTAASGQDLAAAQVIGLANTVPATGTAAAGNTGNGVMTVASAGASVQTGTYTLACTAAASNGGTFSVTAPDGTALSAATVGTPYTGTHLNFTIADGAVDFVVGDTITVAVTAKAKALDLTATDGSQTAAGIMVAACDATLADKPGVAIRREAIVDAAVLIWPTGITAVQKAAALKQLEQLNILSDRLTV